MSKHKKLSFWKSIIRIGAGLIVGFISTDVPLQLFATMYSIAELFGVLEERSEK